MTMPETEQQDPELTRNSLSEDASRTLGFDHSMS